MKAKTWTVVAVIFVALGLVAPGVAAATVPDYLYDLRNSGINGPDASLVALGETACRDNGKNVPKAESIADIAQSSGLDEHDASFLYDSAMQFLC